LALAAAVMMMACGDDSVATQPAPDPTVIPWSVALDIKAATMSTVAPYDTLRISATVRNPAGAVMSDRAPTFASANPERVTVSADGLVTALKTGTKIPVIASYKTGLVTLVDTLLIDVTDESDPPAMSALSLQIAYNPPTSFLSFLEPEYTITSVLLDAFDQPLSSEYRVRLWSSDPTIASPTCCGSVSVQRPGRVTFYAATTLYGVTRYDSVVFDAKRPRFGGVIFQDAGDGTVSFAPTSYVYGPGATVVWLNTSETTTVDVIFDDPTDVMEEDVICACGSGNITALEGGIFAFAARKFPKPGTYTYSTSAGQRGRIVIRDD
jgi:hypothetical protein